MLKGNRMYRPPMLESFFYTEGHSDALSCSVINEFWNKCKVPEVIVARFEIDCKETELQMFHAVKETFKQFYTNIKANFFHRREFYVTDAQDNLLVMCYDNGYRYSRNNIVTFVLEIYGAEEQVTRLRENLQERLHGKKLVKISWYYKTGRGNDCASMHVTGLGQKLHNEFYPWFKQGVDQFVNDFYSSSASVLVLYGPPGTGKTSFLRHMLVSHNISAMVTYDDRILKDDEFFINYLTDEEHNALIVEDADVFLAPREDGDNEMMSKFLNVSDGLIKIINKKMIFTSNITQVSKIDAALLRPGRCFASVEFRELTSAEAEQAALAAGLPDRDWRAQNSWSLAQLFQNPQELPVQKFRMGFGS